MTILDILHHPDPRLKKKAVDVDVVDDDLKQLAKDMLETMYDAPGIGLAAPQINRLIRMIVVDISDEKNQPFIFINPVITHKDGTHTGQEGCLSVPDIYANIERAEHITLEALNLKGEKITMDADEMLAVCVQHEIDHLDGKLFVDYLSKLKQHRILKKNQKRRKTKRLITIKSQNPVLLPCKT